MKLSLASSESSFRSELFFPNSESEEDFQFFLVVVDDFNDLVVALENAKIQILVLFQKIKVYNRFACLAYS